MFPDEFKQSTVKPGTIAKCTFSRGKDVVTRECTISMFWASGLPLGCCPIRALPQFLQLHREALSNFLLHATLRYLLESH